jgi:hypothetical protein
MSETKINITRASFAELEAYLSLEKNKWFIDEMKPLIEANPVTPHSIDRLITEGWVVEKDEKKLFRRGQCCFDDKRITLYGDTKEYRRKPYSRDVTLMHEVVHAHYPRLNSQKTPTGEIFETDEIGEPLTEWMARQLRAEPDVLRASVLWFDLEPHVYDRASYIAFVMMNPPGQKLFPFTYNCLGEIELARNGDQEHELS